MTDPYLWFKFLHIFSFAAWMAGLWYLPRLFVYHSQSQTGTVMSDQFKVMELKLLKTITTPAMVGTWVFGLLTAWQSGAFLEGWLHVKLVLVLLLSAFHGICAKNVRLFNADERPKSEGYFRWFNEIPTVLFAIIVIFAVFKPFS